MADTYRIRGETMTGLANLTRALSGETGAKSPNEMGATLQNAYNFMMQSYQALADKGVDPTGVSPSMANLPGLIAGLPSGGGMKVAHGKVTPAENLYNFEIVHSLGVIPNFALIVSDYSYSKAENESLSTIAFLRETFIGEKIINFQNVRYKTTSNSGVMANSASVSDDYYLHLGWTPSSSATIGYNKIGGLFYGADTSKIYYGHPTLQKFFLKASVPYFYLIGYQDGLYIPYK